MGRSVALRLYSGSSILIRDQMFRPHVLQLLKIPQKQNQVRQLAHTKVSQN